MLSYEERPRCEVAVRVCDREYFSGDAIEGCIELAVKHFPLEVKDIKWFFRVVEHTNARESFSKTSAQLRRYNSNRTLIPAHLDKEDFDSTPMESFQSLVHQQIEDGYFGQCEVLKTGIHKYPFAFVLPSSLPPSFSFGTKGLIQYQICARVFTGGKKKPLKAVFPIQIGGRIFETDFIELNRDSISNKVSRSFPFSAGNIEFSALVNRQVFMVGEEIVGSITVKNNSERVVQDVSLKLVMDTRYVGEYHKPSTIERWTLGEKIYPRDPERSAIARLKIPQVLPGTISKRKNKNVKIATRVQVSYYVLVKAKVSGILGSNIEMRFPLTIIRPDPKLIPLLTSKDRKSIRASIAPMRQDSRSTIDSSTDS